MPFGRKQQHMDNIKRSSYYVCFIGAKESPVVRDHNYGHEFIFPAMHYLLRTVVEAGPLASAPKITLQVSGKGLKIVQNVNRQALVPVARFGPVGITSAGKTDTLKHFIPHHCVTCAFQGEPPYDDLVAAILLIYNPTTRCPVHIHVYRCDSHKTASFLTQQLMTMAERPDNQAKFAEIEMKLHGRGLLQPLQEAPSHIRLNSPPSNGVMSDGQSSSGRGSSSPETSEHGKGHHGPTLSVSSSGGKSLERSPSPAPNPISPNMAKLTAELQQKLKTRDSAPLLLPPKDYDTVNRSRGKTGIFLKEFESSPLPSPAHATNHSDELRQAISARSSKKMPEEKITKAPLPVEDDDDDWAVDDDEEDFREPDAPVVAKLQDFESQGFYDRMKRYSSMRDVFGVEDRKQVELRSDEAQIAQFLAAKAPPLGSPPPVLPVSSDASAAYRPRPYYFNAEDLEPKDSTPRQEQSRERTPRKQQPIDLVAHQYPVPAPDVDPVIRSRFVRPSLPLKRSQRPIVNERLRPASFYERIRFDDQDFREGRFVRPELVYYQYRC